eukprot:2266904-Pyramimonas_sp.AAC.1
MGISPCGSQSLSLSLLFPVKTGPNLLPPSQEHGFALEDPRKEPRFLSPGDPPEDLGGVPG